MANSFNYSFPFIFLPLLFSSGGKCKISTAHVFSTKILKNHEGISGISTDFISTADLDLLNITGLLLPFRNRVHIHSLSTPD